MQQDEDFADLILQRVAMLQYGSLLDIIMKSPELQATIPDLATAGMIFQPFIDIRQSQSTSNLSQKQYNPQGGADKKQGNFLSEYIACEIGR